MFRNDNQVFNTRPYGGTAIYSRLQFIVDTLLHLASLTNGIEITVVKVSTLPNVTITAIYCLPKISLKLLCRSLIQVLDNISFQYNIIIGDFNVNWMNEIKRRPLYNLLVTERNYKQLISHYTTDNRTIRQRHILICQSFVRTEQVILLYMRCRNSLGCSFIPLIFMLYILTYFDMNVLYRIFNIILKSVFDLLSRIHL